MIDDVFILLTKVQSATHKGVYLHTDRLGLLVKTLKEVFIFDKLLVDLLVIHHPFRHWMSRHKSCFDTLEDYIATTALLLWDQLLGDELESSECLLLVGNPVDVLRGLVKTIRTILPCTDAPVSNWTLHSSPLTFYCSILLFHLSEISETTTEKKSFWVTLLCVKRVRELNFQEIIGLHWYYCCMVVLWRGWYRSGDLHRNWWLWDIPSISLCFLILWILFLRKKNSFRLGGWCQERGERKNKREQKKI